MPDNKPVDRKKALSGNPSDFPVINWSQDYVNSPKYNERLSAFYQYPDYVQRQRDNVLSTVSFRENPSGKSVYYPSDNELAISEPQMKSLGATRPEGVTHELWHSVNSGTKNKAIALSPAEAKFIADRYKQLKPVDTSTIYGTIEAGNRSHDRQPEESLSDIQALRFYLKQRGIYDAGTQDITPELLQKAKKDPVIRKTFTLKRLTDNFDDKQLLEIMNKVAANKNTNQSNMA